MKRKLMILTTIVLICLEYFIHYSVNIKQVSKPPSEKWSKEVLLDTANIEKPPKIISYKDSYVTAYIDGQNIKLITCNNYGEKLKEKVLHTENGEPYNISLLTDNNDIYLYWIEYDNTKNIKSLKLDENLDTKEEASIKEIEDLVQIDSSVIIVSYKDKVEVRNIKDNWISIINEPETKLLMGTRYKDEYIIAYSKDYGKYFYSYIRDGKASEPKHIGTLDTVTNISFFNSAISVDDDNGYILVEYRIKGEFGGARIIKFSLATGDFTTDDFKVNGKKVFISNITSYPDGGKGKFLVTTYISEGKKRENLNVAELSISSENNIELTPVSRVRGSVVYPAADKDRVIFYKPIEKGKAQLYLSSSSKDFIEKNNDLKKTEIKQAALDTLESVALSIAYIFVYGALWFVPGVIINGLSFMLNFKSGKKAKRWFAVSYALSSILKCYLIYIIAFKKFAYFMPEFLSLPLGILINASISFLYFAFGYRYFGSDAENNMMTIDFSLAFLMDTIITLVFFLPFFT